jgi:hypothetical protein
MGEIGLSVTAACNLLVTIRTQDQFVGGRVAMYRPGLVALWLAVCAFEAGAARAADGPVVVIPGKAGVPVIINEFGHDASYTIVEGEWGLGRPGVITPRIVAGTLVIPVLPPYRPYFPGFGTVPGYGRDEVEPPADRRLPTPARSFKRSWTSQSEPLPANLEPPAPPPEIVVVPELKTRGRPSLNRP